MEKISALLFMVSAVVFLILFIGQKKKIKQKNYEIEQLKEKNKKFMKITIKREMSDFSN